jgi:5,5'-dehydrodivanillate O-demethylase
VNTTRGFIDDQAAFEAWMVPYGIMKKRIFINGESDQHPLIFPNVLRTGNSTQIRVPIDDTHTWRVDVTFLPAKAGEAYEEGAIEVRRQEPYKDPPDKSHPFTRWQMNTVAQQDHMAWETQGPITDRTIEHLSYSDRAVVLLRRVLQENINLVQKGEGDPLAIVRDPDHAVIDTGVSHDLNATGGGTGSGRPYGLTTGTVGSTPRATR